MNIKAYSDNVIILLDPQATVSKGGIHIQSREDDTRLGTVIASGPGYYTDYGVLVPNETRAGDRIIVNKHAGTNVQDYRMDLNTPRHNTYGSFQELFSQPGEFRVIREQEVACIIEDEAKAAE